MLRVFRHDIEDPERFVITLELVPGREAGGKSVDTVKAIAADAFADGRVSAVSITDNPGGNPSLSPDVLGYDIFKLGLDVIVHFTCRDMNRVGMESRALQLAMMGMKNILALTGDYAGTGFGGQGAPVFDLDSVTLQCMLTMMEERLRAAGDPDPFFTGCAVSPFKATRGECMAQYAKLCRKAAAGAGFVITQLGFDAGKFAELVRFARQAGIRLPVLGSAYLLTPKSARIMNAGQVPGAVVPDRLLDRVNREWHDKKSGRRAAIERMARLGAILKGLGFRGIHIGGIHHSFDPVGKILDRMARIEADWRTFLPDFSFPESGLFHLFPEPKGSGTADHGFTAPPPALPPAEKALFFLLRGMHRAFFSRDARFQPVYRKLCAAMDARPVAGDLFLRLFEEPVKRLTLGCRSCGDCGIAHLAFLCPESGCPKHTRNGACGGSRQGRCEVYPERHCVWYRAHNRWAASGETDQMAAGCIPPRMWKLDQTSSWINFHLGRDHQGMASEFAEFCRARTCTLPKS